MTQVAITPPNMSLYSAMIQAQAEFLLSFAQLIAFAHSKGYVLTLGEGYRPIEMQRIHFKAGRSKTMDSQHMKRLAVDVNVFRNGKLIPASEFKDLGEFWESLHPKNRWGGNFKRLVDGPHFERQL